MTIALVTSKSLISFITSLLPTQREFEYGPLSYMIGIGEHCFGKKELKTLAFS